MTTKQELAVDLGSAIQNSQVVPYFQPIVDLRTGKLAGLEVLARWLHPHHGVIYPADFIATAETNGIIDLLTEKMLEQAFAITSRLPKHITLSVNISPILLRDPTLPQKILSIAKAKSFPLSQLILEITETAVAANADTVIPVIEGLKTLGARLALDDFGTGYSGLRRLQLLPFDEIKVDRSFVQSMTYRKESRKIVATVLGLGYGLGLSTVAEGVETEDQADMLFYLGCELAQGWLYGRAMPARDLPGVLATETLSAPRRTRPVAASLGTRLESHPSERLAVLLAIYDGAPVGLCFLNCDLQYVNLNRRLQEMSGCPDGIRLGETVEEAMPHIHAQIKTHLRRALSGEAISGIEVRTARPGSSGNNHILLFSLQPARDEMNEVIGISVAAVDITERKRAEEALKESADHYRHTVELSPQVTWTADASGNILSAGPLWQVLTGLTLEETLNNGWVKALHPEDAVQTINAWTSSVKTGHPVDVEYRIGKGDGVWHWVRARALPLIGPGGEIVRWYGTVEDVGDRKRAELALTECQSRLDAALNLTGPRETDS